MTTSMMDGRGENQKRDLFEKVWRAPTGFRDWFATVNNQPFGNRFMASSFIFFFLAGVMALLMRLQLAVPENDLLGPSVYNQLFTMHGSTMMYLVVLPFLEGLAIYMLPLVLGTREMAFPRMSAFSFWVFFSGGLVFFTGFLFNAVPDGGWFVYPPLSLNKFSGLGLDFLLVGLGFIEIAGVGTGIEIVTTVLKFRAPGMSLGRMPLFAWAWLVTGVMIIFAFSTLFGATVLIELDRAIGTKFFDPSGGGNVLLWQHLFWFFGHPDVYIMFIPATGMVSMIVPTFARRPIAGYTLIAIAILVTGFLSFGLWAHHMFATGLPPVALGFFIAASLMIALASGTQVFAWIATLWRAKPELTTPMLFILGFIFIFVLGGITGVMVAVLPFDLQTHDTYFVVAHFHYVLIGGVLFPILAGLHYWMPLIIGRLPLERLGRWSFWLIFIGFNLSFFPMHISGFKGMARRVYTYSEDLGIGWLNLISTVGAFILGIGFMVFALNFYISRKRGAPEKKNPWNAGSLEWSVMSDMPNYVFLRPPVIYSRDPLWDEPRDEDRDERLERLSRQMEAAPARWRAALITDVVTGEPLAVQRVAGPSYIPIIAAIGLLVTSLATLFQTYLVALASLIFTLLVVVIWLWPREDELQSMRESGFEQATGLSVEPTGTNASGWWAMIGALTVIGTVFGVLFYSYFYIRLYSSEWPQGGISAPDVVRSGGTYALLLFSAVPFFFGNFFFRHRWTPWFAVAALIGTAGLGLLFIVFVISDSLRIGFSPQINAYASLFHVLTWHIAILVAGGIAFLTAAAIRLGTRATTLRIPRPSVSGYLVTQMQITSLYWYFTVVVGLMVYAVLYLSPHLF